MSMSPREGEAIALQFMTTGAHAAVLRYDVSGQGSRVPAHLLELAASVAYVRIMQQNIALTRIRY